MNRSDISQTIDCFSAQSNNFAIPGVYALFTNTEQLPAFGAALVATLSRFEDTETGFPAYTQVHTILVSPNETESEEYRNGNDLAEKLFKPPKDDENNAISESFVIKMLPAETSTLGDLLCSLPPKNAVIVQRAERIYSKRAEVPPLITTLRPKGSKFTFRLNTKVAHSQAFETTAVSLEAAEKHSLMVVLLFNLPTPNKDSWPQEIYESPLFACGGTDHPEKSNLEQDVEKLMQSLADGSLPDSKYFEAVVQLPAGDALKALLSAHIYAVKGQMLSAWLVLAPFHEEIVEENHSNALFVSSVAAQTNQTSISQGILEKCIPVLSLPHDLGQALAIAEVLQHPSIAHLKERLLREFPNYHVTKTNRFHEYVANQNWVEAEKLAIDLDDKFLILMCACFSKSPLEAATFIDEARQLEMEDRAHSAVAKHYFSIEDLDLALFHAINVRPESPYFEEAMNIRISILSRSPSPIYWGDDDHQEFESVLRHVACNPKNYELKFAVERLLSHSYEKNASDLLLGNILFEEFSRQFLAIEQSDFRFDERAGDLPKGATIEQYLEFFSNFGTDRPTEPLPLCSFSENQRKHCSPSFLRHIHAYVERTTITSNDLKRDQKALIVHLHMASIICKEYKIRGYDYILWRLAIGRMATQTFGQSARDLGETCLQITPYTQPEMLLWRISQGWNAIAESYQRTNNNRAAILHLCLSLLSLDYPTRHLELSLASFRLGSRIFRQAGRPDYAAQLIDLEERISIATGAEFNRSQLGQLRLSIKLQALTPLTSVNVLLSLLQECMSLEFNPDAESAPIISCLIAIVGELTKRGIDIPKEASDRISLGLDSCEPRTAALLKSALSPAITREELLSLISNVISAAFADDLGFDIGQLSGAAHTGVSSAVSSNDLELLLLAIGLLSQPALTTNATTFNPNIGVSHNSLLLDILKEEIPFERAKELLKDGEFPSPTALPLDHITNLTIGDVQNCLAANETLFLCGLGRERGFVSVQLTKESVSNVALNDNANWNFNEFIKYKQDLPQDYGKWGASPSLSPFSDPKKVIESFAGLNLPALTPNRIFTFSPTKDLFGFPFGLCAIANSLLPTNTIIAQTPSPSWLQDRRENPWSGSNIATAWFGHPTKCDARLNSLSTSAAPFLSSSKIVLDRSETLPIMPCFKLVIVGLHGVFINQRHFIELTDGYSKFRPEMFSRHVANSGCVILLSCGAGEIASEFHSFETEGLVSLLLSRGVRSVLAPLWPIRIDIASEWLKYFLQALEIVETVGEAATLAADHLFAASGSHPCAWGTMTLFGDPLFRIAPIGEC